MLKHNNLHKSNNLSELRATAEKRFINSHLQHPAISSSPADLSLIIQELEIHQIELEMQQEELIHSRYELTKSMDELKENLERYTELYDFAPVGYLTLSHDTKILQANLTATKLLGVERSLLLGSRFISFINPADISAFKSMFQNLFRNMETEYCEVKLFTRNMQYSSEHIVRIDAILSNDGQECRIILSDITARKKAEDELHNSEELFRKLFQDHSAIKLLIDSNTGDILDANHAAANFYGWPIEQLRQMNIHQINTLPPEQFEIEIKKYRASNIKQYLFRHRMRNGSTRDVEVYANIISLQDKQFTYEIIVDITERKRLEYILAFRTRLLEQSESNSVEEVLRATLDNIEHITESSISFCHFIRDDRGAPSLQIWSTNTTNNVCKMHQHQGGHPSLDESAIWSDLLQTGQPVIHNDTATLMNRRGIPEGHPEIKRELVIPIIEGGTIKAIIGVGNKSIPYDDEDIRLVSSVANLAWDIVVKKRAEQSEQKMQESLQHAQKMELVGQLAGGIAHDFNNMLTVILGHAELALNQSSGDRSLIADMEAIYKAGIRSADLTRQLLAFARKQTIMPVILQLNTIVDNILPMLRRLIGESITLLWIPDTNNTLIKIDLSQIDQILVNLCVNARDAIFGIGTITIQTGLIHVGKSDCEAAHPCALPGNYVTLSVTDTGSGISQNIFPHIFEPFFTTKEVGKGTGMGLSTVYGIVKQNNGFIDFQSLPGKETRFTIYLPQHTEQTSQTNQESQQETEVGSTKATILLVDDEQDILTMCKSMLEMHGYTILQASSPTRAIQIATNFKGRINLLLTDVVMPEMNGSDLSIKLKTICKNLKILFMSAYTKDIIAQHGVFEQGSFFIQKPFSLKKLLKTIQEILKTDVTTND